MEGEGGKIVITTRMAFDHHLSPPNGQLGPSLIVEFADTGPGIEAAVLDEVATPFFTTRPEGRGWGSRSRDIGSRATRGRCVWRARREVGTTVRIALPLSRPK